MADMKNVRNVTCSCVNYANFTVATKQHELTVITMYRGWVTLPSLGIFTQAGLPYPQCLNMRINILIKHKRDYLGHFQ